MQYVYVQDVKMGEASAVQTVPSTAEPAPQETAAEPMETAEPVSEPSMTT